MTIKALAAAVTVITGLGIATAADARCGGSAVTDGAPPASAATAPRHHLAAPEIVVSDDEGLATNRRRETSTDRIPLDDAGMPRRRC